MLCPILLHCKILVGVGNLMVCFDCAFDICVVSWSESDCCNRVVFCIMEIVCVLHCLWLDNRGNASTFTYSTFHSCLGTLILHTYWHTSKFKFTKSWNFFYKDDTVATSNAPMINWFLLIFFVSNCTVLCSWLNCWLILHTPMILFSESKIEN